jgi:hypothetical protein
MGLLLEILAFFLLFLIFRQAVLKAFPVKAVNLSLSDDSIKALKLFKRRYLFLFWLFTGLISFILTVLFYNAYQWFHFGPNYDLVLMLDASSFFLPALILALLSSTFIARWLNNRLQKDGLSFFFEDYQDEIRGFEQNKLQLWQVLIAFACAVTMLFAQFHCYLKVEQENVYYRSTLSEDERVFKKSEITSIQRDSAGVYRIVLNSSDTIDMHKFGSDKSDLVEALMP